MAESYSTEHKYIGQLGSALHLLAALSPQHSQSLPSSAPRSVPAVIRHMALQQEYLRQQIASIPARVCKGVCGQTASVGQRCEQLGDSLDAIAEEMPLELVEE